MTTGVKIWGISVFTIIIALTEDSDSADLSDDGSDPNGLDVPDIMEAENITSLRSCPSRGEFHVNHVLSFSF